MTPDNSCIPKAEPPRISCQKLPRTRTQSEICKTPARSVLLRSFFINLRPLDPVFSVIDHVVEEQVERRSPARGQVQRLLLLSYTHVQRSKTRDGANTTFRYTKTRCGGKGIRHVLQNLASSRIKHVSVSGIAVENE